MVLLLELFVCLNLCDNITCVSFGIICLIRRQKAPYDVKQVQFIVKVPLMVKNGSFISLNDTGPNVHFIFSCLNYHLLSILTANGTS